MAKHHLLSIVDAGEGKVQAGWQREGKLPRMSKEALPFTNPFGAEEREALRWYLEDYLNFPYGAERERAAWVEASMKEWGTSLFGQVFDQGDRRTGPPAFYQEATAEHLRNCELCISSGDASFLGIPWELLFDPAPGRGYLAQQLAGVYRQWTGQAMPPREDVARADGRFRVLLVIARPYGERDVPLGTVARPVLEALRPHRSRIALEVLRPPTFDELTTRLHDRPGHYDLIHFDGHGVFTGTLPSHVPHYGMQPGKGHLVFEDAEGDEHIVNSEDLGQALADCGVPLFLLNACQSAVEGQDDPFASVASQLVATGAKGVVAMNHSVYADTAALFMARLYERLVAGEALSEAVAAGRKTLFTRPQRRSVIGPLELRDWCVPALYQDEARLTPIAAAEVEAGEGAAQEAVQDEAVREHVAQVCPNGRYGFIGRDYEILRIERALRNPEQPGAILTGMGGIGKTELAYGFARWYAETGGCPGGVFATDFKTKADFGQIVGSVVGFGSDFSRLSDAQQWNVLVRYLREQPCLLIWDNFETVNGYPAGAEPLAPEAEREKLARFVQALRGGKSRILITTRKPAEDWLGVNLKPIEMGGLNTHDAALMAQGVLQGVGRKPEDFSEDPAYGRLVDLLRGHPRSMEIILPLLKTQAPGGVIEALQHRIDAEATRLEDASLSMAFEHMSDKARLHLPFLGLFTTRVDADTLGIFVARGDEPEEAYKAVFGETPDAAGWEVVLDEAAGAGLVRALGSRIYELHPTLPAFLRCRLAEFAGEEGVQRVDHEFLQFYAAWGSSCLDGARKADPNVLAAIHIEEGNLLRAVRLAEAGEHWADAQAIVQPLNEFYEARGRLDEWRALRAALVEGVGRSCGPDAERDRASLWMFLLGEEANDGMSRNDLDSAEQAHTAILEYLLALEDASVEPQIATAYHQLGMVAEERHRYEAAEEWHRKALEIRERLELEADAASDYHQLGNVKYLQNRYEAAEEWYRKALEIKERLGLEAKAADGYHQLGILAQARHRYEAAEGWYRKALEVFEQLGMEAGAADEYHQLGIVAQERHQYEAAEAWYRKALEVYERLGLEADAASDYHQLGRVAQERHRYEAAEDWYRKALAVFERLNHPPLMVNTLAQFGVLRREQERYAEAVAWFGRALAIAAEYKMHVAGQILGDLARCLKLMGEAAFITAWGEAFGGQAPEDEMMALLRQAADQIGDEEA